MWKLTPSGIGSIHNLGPGMGQLWVKYKSWPAYKLTHVANGLSALYFLVIEKHSSFLADPLHGEKHNKEICKLIKNIIL